MNTRLVLLLVLAMASATGIAGNASLYDENGQISINPNKPREANDLENPERRIKNKKETGTIKFKMYQGLGPEAQMRDPSYTYRDVRIEFDKPDGVDENGHPMTLKKRRRRVFVHRFADEYVKSYRENVQKGTIRDVKIQSNLEQWKRQTEETKRYVKEHGPITTKKFVRPGMNEDEAAHYYDKNTRVRVVNGKIVPIYGPNEVIPVTRSQAQIDREEARRRLEAEAAARPVRREVIEQKNVARKMPGLDAMQADFERNGGERIRTPEDLKRYAPEEIQKPIDNLPEEKPFSDERSDAGKWIFKVFGINTAHAEGVDYLKTNPHMQRFATEGVSSENRYSQSGRFDNSVEEFRRSSEEIKAKFKKKGDTPCAQCSLSKEPLDATNELSEKRAREEAHRQEIAPKNHIKDFASEAKEIRALVADLNPERFDSNTAAMLKQLNDPEFKGSPYEALKSILESHPEIRDHIPDVDKRLESIRLGAEDSIKKLSADELKKYQTTYIFASWSLGEEAMADILKHAASTPNTVVVMRGYPAGMTFAQGLKHYKSFVASIGLKTLPAFTIDPPLFREFGITQVPVVVHAQNLPDSIVIDPRKMKRAMPRMIAKVSGLAREDWLLEKIDQGELGDLGIRGNLFPIDEPDLIEVMKQKVMAVDWEKKKRDAIARYWTKREFFALPTARKTREFELDPTIVATEDIKDLGGNFIHKKGDKVNPLHLRAFSNTVIVFNPTVQAEVKRVKNYLKEHESAGLKKPLFVLTEIDKKKGWDAYQDISDEFDSHMYFLNEQMIERWNIVRTPTVIWANPAASVFSIRELGPIENEEAMP